VSQHKDLHRFLLEAADHFIDRIDRLEEKIDRLLEASKPPTYKATKPFGKELIACKHCGVEQYFIPPLLPVLQCRDRNCGKKFKHDS